MGQQRQKKAEEDRVMNDEKFTFHLNQNNDSKTSSVKDMKKVFASH